MRREPSLLFCAVNQDIFTALMVIYSFPTERTLGTYYASTYSGAKIVAEMLIELPISLQKFFLFMLFMLL